MGKAPRDEELPFILGGEFHGHVLPIGWASPANVYGYVEDTAHDYPHQLGLGVGRPLEVEASQHAGRGAGLVVLDKLRGLQRSGVLCLLVGLEEVPPAIAKDFGMENQDARDVGLLDV